MEPIRSTSPPARHWRVSVLVSLGILLLLASLVVAAMALESPARLPASPSSTTSTPTEEQRWYSLGYADIEGGVTPLYPLQPGRVISIEAKENDQVKAGTPLFHLDDTVPQLKVRAAKADLEAAKAKLAIAEAQLEQANRHIDAQKTAIEATKKNVEKARLLYQKKKDWEKKELEGDKDSVRAAEIDVQQAELGVKGEERKLALAESAKGVAEEYVRTAKANIEAKETQLDEATNAVKECVIRAPVDGTTLRILVNVGQLLGSNPRQPAIQFAAQRPLLVRADVGQEFAGRIRLDQNVVILDDVTSQECARGKVVSISRWYAPRRNAASEMLTMNSDFRTLECIIQIESTSQDIRIEQRVRVKFPD
jgi:multidrug resistance efflux pump